MQVLEFIFQSFWHFLGSAIIIYIIVEGIVNIIKALKDNPSSEDRNNLW